MVPSLRWNNTIEKSRSASSVDADDDLRLLRLGRAGDGTALASLLTRHEAALYRLCRSMSGQDSDAEDALQETFLRALRAFHRPGGFRGDASVSTFLHRVAVNVCLDRLRQTRALAAWEGGDDTEQIAGDDPERTVLTRLTIREALTALGPTQRALLLLRERDGRSIAEIAELMGWNVKKADNELYKMRKALAAWRERNLV